jgi:TetR/AcrR family acrAB operon transcriptional repressor
MVRKTKEEALATRTRLLDAAEHLFAEFGVAGTSLHRIAEAAGVTRGAVYHHFVDKGDLFNAMMARVCLPMEESTGALLGAAETAPLDTVRKHLLVILAGVAANTQVQRVFEIAIHKVEYVGELTTVRERRLQMRGEHITLLEGLLRQGQRQGQVQRTPPARQMAIGLHALLDGLIHNWMLDPSAFDLLGVGRHTVRLHLDGLACGAAAAAGAAGADAAAAPPARSARLARSAPKP